MRAAPLPEVRGYPLLFGIYEEFDACAATHLTGKASFSKIQVHSFLATFLLEVVPKRRHFIREADKTNASILASMAGSVRTFSLE